MYLDHLIDFTDASLPTYSSLYFGLSLDGNGKTVSNISSNCTLFSKDTAYGYSSDLNIRNITFDNCSYVYGFGKYLYGSSSPCSFTNVVFKNCISDYCVTDYVYGTTLVMENCKFSNCDCRTTIAYGTYEYSSPATINLNNVDVENTACSGGAYLFYCGYGTINMTDCDATNITNCGISTMACGGFIGNASGAKVTLTSCKVSGSIFVPSGAVAGFIGQSSASKTPVLVNCKVLQNTYLRNMGSGRVIAFCDYLTEESSGNKFYGYACSTNIENCTGITFVKGENWLKHTPLSSDDFTFNTNGSLIYSGEDEFEKLVISQSITFSRYDSQKDEWKGGFSRYIGDEIIVKDVVGETNLGYLPYVTNYVQIVDENNPVALQYSTEDISIISNNTWCNSTFRVYFNDGLLAMDSRLYSTGGFDCFTGANESTPITEVTMTISINSYDGNDILINSLQLYYSFNPSVI